MRKSIVGQLPRYSRWRRARGGLEIGYPWITVGAMVTVEHHVLMPNTRVLELGSGGSTVFWAMRVPEVVSLETKPEWAEKTREALKQHGVAHRVNLCLKTHAEALEWAATLPDNHFDLLFVDHDDPEYRGKRGSPFDRMPLAMTCLPKLRPEGWMLVDNYETHGMEKFDYGGWNVYRFDDLRYAGRGTLLARRHW